jgi:hypothetical protein
VGVLRRVQPHRAGGVVCHCPAGPSRRLLPPCPHQCLALYTCECGEGSACLTASCACLLCRDRF